MASAICVSLKVDFAAFFANEAAFKAASAAALAACAAALATAGGFAEKTQHLRDHKIQID